MRHGAYCDEAVATPSQLVKLPSTFDYAEGATFLARHGTAYHALIDRGQLQPGEVLLVHGAAGGVGLAAVEIGKMLGAQALMFTQVTRCDVANGKSPGYRDQKTGETYYNYDTNRVTFRDDLSGVAQPSFVDPHGVGFNTLLQARF